MGFFDSDEKNTVTIKNDLDIHDITLDVIVLVLVLVLVLVSAKHRALEQRVVEARV